MPSVDRLVEYLRAFQKRKPMYVHPVDVKAVQNFLIGFEVGCHACGFEIDREFWWAAQEARGWDRRSVGPIPQMEAKGMSEAEIMDELVEIEILMLREQEERTA
ncbi:hypothetical protein OJF2_41320 [Aquisphaera giovannonii]|uniref:Uncharacterized protein n=1 Tax=Aquisphaera giovannonii TaxID=406548 RepID=A0A5B9W602_9BACT|nr:hypothetical protein [Aquisphaera giovannonii]QEH35579.1 hypothetical protein OJF2_41320 [Aquisphaera giovannonii]